MVLIFFFKNFSKNAWRMILFLLHICHHTLILYKTAEKPIVMWLFTQNCIKSTVLSLVSLVTFYYQDNNKVDLTAYWRRPYCHADSDIQECSCWQQPVVNIQHSLKKAPALPRPPPPPTHLRPTSRWVNFTSICTCVRHGNLKFSYENVWCVWRQRSI